MSMLLGPEATRLWVCPGRFQAVVSGGVLVGWLFENCTVDASIFDLLWSSV